MKKFDFEEFKAQILFGIIVCLFIGVIFFIYYIEENYELTRYLWTFNIIVLILTPLYYLIYYLREKSKTKNIENNTIIKNIDFKYYRDIIDGYSPALLSFILDGTEMKKDFSASIIYLINKGYLEQIGEKVKRTDKSINNLSEDLQIICNNIDEIFDTIEKQTKEMKDKNRNNIVVSYSKMIMGKWYKSIEKEAIEKGLVNIRESFKLSSFLSILCFLESIYTFSIESWGLWLFSLFLFFLLIFIKVWVYDENKWVKTQKGYELYVKILGLKNYIKDYSRLSERELREISIWEDYLIYAIIFNNTSNLNKEALEFYDKLFCIN